MPKLPDAAAAPVSIEPVTITEQKETTFPPVTITEQKDWQAKLEMSAHDATVAMLQLMQAQLASQGGELAQLRAEKGKEQATAKPPHEESADYGDAPEESRSAEASGEDVEQGTGPHAEDIDDDERGCDFCKVPWKVAQGARKFTEDTF